MKKKAATRQVSTSNKCRSRARNAVVEAQEFRLVDRSGQSRAVLELTRTGPRLAMMHEDGAVALEFVMTRGGPVICLADDVGRTRLFIGATRGAARMSMADGKGAQRAFLGVNAGGTPALTLYDGEQRRVWTTAR